MEQLKINDYYNLSLEEILNHLKTSKNGLSHAEAIKRIAEYGDNTIHLPRKLVLKKLFRNLFYNLNFINFLISLILAFLLKNKYLILLFIIIIIFEILLNLFRILKINHFNQDVLPKKTTIIRDEQKIYTSSINLVPGDILELEEGDIAPADLRIIDLSNNQQTNHIFYNTENSNFLLQGEINQSKTIRAVVVKTGMETMLGQTIITEEKIKNEDPIFFELILKYNILKLIIGVLVITIIFLINPILNILYHQIIEIILIILIGSIFMIEFDNLNLFKKNKLSMNLKTSFQIAYSQLININQSLLLGNNQEYQKIKTYLKQGIKLIINIDQDLKNLTNYLSTNSILYSEIKKKMFTKMSDVEIIKQISDYNVILTNKFDHQDNLRLSKIIKNYNIRQIFVSKFLSDIPTIKNSFAGIVVNDNFNINHQRNLENCLISKSDIAIDQIIKEAKNKIINLEELTIINFLTFFMVIFLIFIGLINYYFNNLPYLINPIQLILITIPIQYLIIHNFKKTRDLKINFSKNNFFFQIFKIDNLKKYIATPLAFNLLAYLLFLTIFKLNNLSPFHISTTNPYFLQATTSVFIFFNIALYINLYFETKHIKMNYFFNKRLFITAGLNLLLDAIVLYTNILRHYVWSLNLIELLTIILMSFIFFTLKLLGQHIKKHNRKSILKLHEEIIHLMSE